MSAVPISRSPDLKRLRDEGYEVEVYKGYLLIHHVPYVNTKGQLAYGTLVSTLTLAGNVTTTPDNHVVMWVGDHPCDDKGIPRPNLVANSTQAKIRDDIVTSFSFSQKPNVPYSNYYEKMTGYIRILEGYAHAIDPSATSQTYPGGEITEEESVFRYLDNASSRAGIVAVNENLKDDRIAIVGLGGTGAYVLDFVAKTLVAEINLFDKDIFLQHNAFRCPGAASFDELTKNQTKVGRFEDIYSKMRRRIIAYPEHIDETNLDKLKPMTFVFLCVDKGPSRQKIATYLIENKIPFIDLGMGLYTDDDANTVGGLVRATACLPGVEEQVKKRMPYAVGDEDNEYSRNIQIAELNALNAVLAVIKWKKFRGVYVDLQKEHHIVYGIDTNVITNDEATSNEAKNGQA